jgi:shikimate kinase
LAKNQKKIIAIIGFMGAGKSTIGLLLASMINLAFVDLDKAIESECGKSINEIFAEEGEESFRECEHKALTIELGGKGKIISCGGGIVLREDNVEILRKRCRVFYLKISTREAMNRLSKEERPLLAGKPLEETVISLMEERAEKYLSAAHEVIDTDNRSQEEIAEEIAGRWLKYKSGRPEAITGSI